MSFTLAQLPINPFEDNIVYEPREAEPAVSGLNDHALINLVNQFARLEAKSPPRLKPLHLKAQLVISAEPGYGKSHLLGRLFHKLADRATRIYLRPFQDPDSSWRSVLLKMVQELHRPENPERTAQAPGEFTQLDAFAHGVLAHLLAGLIESGAAACDEPELRARELRMNPLKAFGHGASDHYLASWMRQQFAGELLRPMSDELEKSGVELSARRAAWLKVLFWYAYGNTMQRAACLEWIKGEGMSEDEAEETGLQPAEIPSIEETAAARNEAAKARVMDLLALSGFYRPFVLCFDQSEMMTGRPEAAAEFGRVVEQLVACGLNHLLVVTANLTPWEKICQFIEDAHLARITDPGIQLSGIDRQQAEELARSRLRNCDVASDEVDRFVTGTWLEKFFQSKPTCSVRQFLRQCASHFGELTAQTGGTAELSLEDCFQQALHDVRSKAGRLDFDAQVLRWSVSRECAGGALAEFTVQPHKSQKGYFASCWKSLHTAILLGFEDSSNWKRWEAILREADRQKQHATSQSLSLRVLFLRTPEQRKIPGDGWKVLRPRFEAEKHWFLVECMARQDWEIVVAAYELFANSMEGNIPFSRDATLAFVRTRLQPWWKRLSKEGAPPAPSPPPPMRPPDLEERIRSVLSARLFLSLDQLVAMLPDPASVEDVLAACQQMPEVRIFATTQATALKWTSSPSLSRS
ncbi:hypothetical protein [Prosthecobacter sp.]|uniref:hypothetical protein n=1 Tax=Prosthecobacter sp. TaxID=1965333 RepID=UPI00378343E8